MLITLTAKVSDTFPAQEREVTLRAGFHRPPREVAIRLVVALAVQNVRAQRRRIEIGGDWRQTFVIDWRYDRMAVRAVEGLALPDIIHLVILHSGSEQLADDFGKGDGAS